MPCANTYSYALAHLDSQQVNAQIAAWFVRDFAQSRCREEPSRLLTQESKQGVHLTIDGKALKGTGKHAYGGEEPQKHLLHVYEVQTGMVLQQCPIALQHNEVSTLKPLLTEVLCKGRILTADAAQSYHEFRRFVKLAGGEVIVFIKNNTQRPERILNSFLKILKPIEARGKALNESRKGMDVWNDARLSPVLISMTIYTAIGAKSDKSFVCSKSAQAKRKAAWMWSTAGQACLVQPALPSAFCN